MKNFIQFMLEEKELSQSDLKNVEKFADEIGKKFKIDVNFTKHFADRVNDKRNKIPITVEELKEFFRAAFKKYGGKIKMLGDDAEAVLNQISSDLNLPFVMKWDDRQQEWDLVSLTIMRKKAFKSPDPKLSFQ